MRRKKYLFLEKENNIFFSSILIDFFQFGVVILTGGSSNLFILVWFQFFTIIISSIHLFISVNK